MKVTISDAAVREIEAILQHGKRVEIAIEQGKVVVIEIGRKVRVKE